MFIVHCKRNIMFQIYMFLFEYSTPNARLPLPVTESRLLLIHSRLFQNHEKKNATEGRLKFEERKQFSKLSEFVKTKNSISKWRQKISVK